MFSLFGYMQRHPNDHKFADAMWQNPKLVARAPRYALQTAIALGFVETVKQLLLQYIDQRKAWVQDAHLAEAFCTACERGHHDVVAVLIEKKIFDRKFFQDSSQPPPPHYRHLGKKLYNRAILKVRLSSIPLQIPRDPNSCFCLLHH